MIEEHLSFLPFLLAQRNWKNLSLNKPPLPMFAFSRSIRRLTTITLIYSLSLESSHVARRVAENFWWFSAGGFLYARSNQVLPDGIFFLKTIHGLSMAWFNGTTGIYGSCVFWRKFNGWGKYALLKLVSRPGFVR